MFRIRFSLFAFLSTLTAITASAQTTPPVKTEPPPKPSSTAASGGFRSTFENYRRFDAELPLSDWRKVNETVHDRGGWQAYAREAAKANATKPVGESK